MIQRWRVIFPNDGGYMTEDKCGKWVYYSDHKALVKELVEALEASRKAINTLDEDALGMGTREDGHGGINYWPFKVELLHQIDTAIAKAKEVS